MFWRHESYNYLAFKDPTVCMSLSDLKQKMHWAQVMSKYFLSISYSNWHKNTDAEYHSKLYRICLSKYILRKHIKLHTCSIKKLFWSLFLFFLIEGYIRDEVIEFHSILCHLSTLAPCFNTLNLIWKQFLHSPPWFCPTKLYFFHWNYEWWLSMMKKLPWVKTWKM